MNPDLDKTEEEGVWWDGEEGEWGSWAIQKEHPLSG